jgi:FKBP-type peptidyl-prolyl cis-trans isomerase SlyD
MKQRRITPGVVCVAILCAVLGTATVQADAQERGRTVSAGTRVSIEYTLRLDDKAVLETNVGATPFTYVHGAHRIIPGLEKALEGMKIGERKQITVPPEAGYGVVNQQAFLEVKKDQIPSAALRVGATVQGRAANGQLVRARVTELKDDTVVLDFNHPLAGKTLYFDVKVLDIQPAPGK